MLILVNVMYLSPSVKYSFSEKYLAHAVSAGLGHELSAVETGISPADLSNSEVFGAYLCHLVLIVELHTFSPL